jgi:hypothetical protein
MEIVQQGGYPELYVDGAPFFLHSATFFYFRIPRDLWERSLDRHRELGINTIDLHIPWNWHEPREGEWDFDGHSNPRRDLRTLLRLIAEKGFKLIIRPEPVIGDDWRHAGYPYWLLARPEYGMNAEARLEGRYPPLVELAAHDPEAAAKAWLANTTHMAYARKRLSRVAQELEPYGARRTLTLQVPREKGEADSGPARLAGEPQAGPLLLVQLGGELGGGAESPGPAYLQYISELRAMLEAAGLEGPFCVNVGTVRSAITVPPGTLGAMGEWFLRPAPSQPAPSTKFTPSGAEGLPSTPPARPAGEAGQSEAAPADRILGGQDLSNLEFSAGALQTQPAFPAILIGYQAGWHAPADDSRAFESQPANTLLSSRLLLGRGARGLNYLPAQDTLTPAGYDTPSANRYYRWDAALDLSSNARPPARALKRNAALLEQWGGLLATSHRRADFGFLLPSGGLGGEEALRLARAARHLERVADLAGLALEVLDPEQQPVEQLVRDAVVLLPSLDGGERKPLLSERAQGVLLEYVRRGGTLVFFPPLPPGRISEELWGARPGGQSGTSGNLGSGRVVRAKDSYSWVQVQESLAQTRMRGEAASAVQALQDLLKDAGSRPALRRASERPSSGELVMTELVSDAGTGLLGARSGGQGLLSVTNLSYEEAGEETIQVLSPAASARGTAQDYITLSLLVPARESLLLPLHYSLCSAARPRESCKDEVITAGAELLRVAREGNTLELIFYAPARASVLLRLGQQPGRVSLDEFRPENSWTREKQQLQITLPRGAWPDFVRVLRIGLPYTPRVAEKPKEKKVGRADFEYAVADAVRLPLGDEASLPSDPPLVLVDQEHNGQMLVQGTNYGESGRGIDFKIEGPIRGSGEMTLGPNDTRQTPISLHASKELEAGSDRGHPAPASLLQGQMEVKSGRDHRHSPILFAVVPEEGVTPYQYDLDRDGWNEWVLENSGMRVIVSPEAGGRAVALLDKVSGASLLTSIGGMLDEFVVRDPERVSQTLERAVPDDPPLDSARGAPTLSPALRDQGHPQPGRGMSESRWASTTRVRTFNRPYRAEWVKEKKNTALRLRYTLPDAGLSGGALEKTVHLTGTDTLEVDYQVETRPGRTPGDVPASPPQAGYAFVAASSIPALLREEASTRFCWLGPPEAPQHCEMFGPGREPISLPETARRLEIHTPGRFGMALEWGQGKMTIEMKSFSAMLRLAFPLLPPGAEAQRYQVRYRALPAE